jgi:hypothetical protein
MHGTNRRSVEVSVDLANGNARKMGSEEKAE